jgi:endo-1,4-beta-xylanase
VDENYMKWYSIERERGRIDFARGDAHLRFAQQHGMAMRGHCLFWSKEKFVSRQPWLLELSADELRQAMDEHLREVVSRYRGRVIAWDVNNEMLDGSWYRDKLGDDIRPWMFSRARAFDPHVPLHVNEYGILGSEEKTGRYVELIRGLMQAGAPVTGIGIQEHACERIVTRPSGDETNPERQHAYAVTPQHMWQTLDTLAAFKLPIHLTEISAKHADPHLRADAIEAILRVGFAHPSVEAILLWGFWERRHWLGKDAALLDADLNPLPAGERLSQLLNEEWRTRATLQADVTGAVTFRGYFGRYRITVADQSATLPLTPGIDKVTVTLAPDAPRP